MEAEVKRPNRPKIDQIRDMWKEDAPFSTDPLKLPEEASRTLSDLAKYRDLKFIEQRKLAKMQIGAEAFRFRLMRFYRDGVAKADDPMLIQSKERKWEVPPGGKPPKTDVKFWVDSNHDMVELILNLSEQNDIIEFIDGIIKDLGNRSFSINETMKQVRYNNGSPI